MRRNAVTMWYGRRGDTDTQWFSSPPLECPCVEIILEFTTTYQKGAGSASGKLSLRLVRNGLTIAEEDISSPTNSPQMLRVIGKPVTTLSCPGDTYAIYRRVGDTSNHKLSVSNFSIGLSGPIIYPPVESNFYDVMIPAGAKAGQILQARTPDFKTVCRAISRVTLKSSSTYS